MGNKTLKKFSSNQIALPDYGIYVESHRHDSNFAMEMHSHAVASMFNIIAGKGVCLAEGNEYDISANDAILLKPDVPHQLIDKPKAPMTVLVVYFGSEVERINSTLLEDLYRSQIVTGTSMHRCMTIRNELRKMLDEQHSREVNFAEAIRQSFSRILLQLKRSLADQPERETRASASELRVQQVLDYVQQRFYEPPSLAEAARLGALSTRQFTTICRKITNQSYLQYINSLRIKKSADMLKNTSMSVAAIAFEAGFEDLSTFYRAFKRYCNTSPQEYRNKHLPKR